MTHVPLMAGILATGVFGTFVWAVRGHFTSVRMPPGMWAVSVLSALCFVGYGVALTGRPQPLVLLSTGMGLLIAALALFVWAARATRVQALTLAFDTDSPTFLVQSGRYRYVRHLFYSSYMLFWCSAALQVCSGILTLGIGGLLTLYLLAAVREEQKFARSPLAPAYQAYKSRSGRFLPILLAARS